MKKVLFLWLFLLILGTAGISAQVTIGANEEPHPGAVLDLKSYDKGLLLPNVYLIDANVFQLSPDRESEAVGMMVYNISDVTLNGRGTGVYVWNGTKWMFVALSGSVQTPVTDITVRTQGDVTSIMSGFSLQFLADVLPGNATNRGVTWSVVPYAGTGTGTVNPATGLFTGNVAGTVTVRATAQDGSNVYGDKQITVSPASIPVTGITISPSTAQSITAGQQIQFTASVIPSDADDQDVTWSISSGGTGAIVTQSGLFTGLMAGQYTVSARSAGDPSVSAAASVTVGTLIAVPTCQNCIEFLRTQGYPDYPYYRFDTSNKCMMETNDWHKIRDVRRYRIENGSWVYDEYLYGQNPGGAGPCDGLR
ncbi:hypothetical protein FACS189451_11730 [Bacteroidia bacterium]|nr:hypothetical protein FACS189446_4900 [Bacteroidia bacterium]GHT64253.1 hypothetical protein FACS189451_11730 [Bacteroidia bacterium]